MSLDLTKEEAFSWLLKQIFFFFQMMDFKLGLIAAWLVQMDWTNYSEMNCL